MGTVPFAENRLQSAIEYAGLGYSVFPCRPHAKTPLTEHGHLDATTVEEQLQLWWSETPDANVGIRTDGLLVVDVDAESTWLSINEDRLRNLAVAPLSLTANGGRHYVFRQPKSKSYRCTVGRLAPHVDTRADGGYIVAPPSVLAGGKAYRWEEGMALDERPERLPEPPSWLLEQLDLLVASTPSSPRVAVEPHVATLIPAGQRNAALTSLAGTMRRVGMAQGEIEVALQRANTDRCQPPLSQGEVARIAESVARYQPAVFPVSTAKSHVDEWHDEPADSDDLTPECCDPGPLPDRLLRTPGFVSELVDHCLATAPYPNPVLAFVGALVLQGFLAGRKMCDPGDNRTNLYVLGLAHSSAGKDWPRKLNTQIAHRVGLADGIGERFASGEGIEDALFANPNMLFQTDEIDGLLQMINRARDNRYENIVGTLLTMYSSSNSVFPMRRKAGRDSRGAIDQPNLTIFGTAIPNHYYAALSERMLTNGLFARMLVLEGSRRGAGQDPVMRKIPDRILEIASWWANFQPGTGNQSTWHPEPVVVAHTDEARSILSEARQRAEAEYQDCEQRNDPVGTTVWGRVSEQSRKLALIYSISENPYKPMINRAAADWAVELVMHQTRRMLFMAGCHVSETEFDQRCKRVIDALTIWRTTYGDRWMPYRDLSRRFRWSRREHEEVRDALLDQERIEIAALTTGGRPKLIYRLRTSSSGTSG